MIAKCPCQQCGVNIEFDAEQAKQFVACPSCGGQTRLLIPSDPPPEQRLSPAESLKQIRQQTCYQTLRSLINILQFFCFIFAGLIALGALVSVFDYSQIKTADDAAGESMSKMVFGGRIILGLAGAIAFVFLAIAGKQSALLLVDIADCQIRLAGKTK